MSDLLKVGWFSTGRGQGSRNLLRAVMEQKRAGELEIEIPFVFCNWDNTEEENPRREQRQMFFDLVASYNIPLITLSWKKFLPELRAKDENAWRLEYGREMRRLISYEFDVGMLAGYMLWVDDETCRKYRLLNLHPALPDGPKGTWQEVIWKLIEQGAEEQGAMIHICTEDWDRGPPVSYCRFPIRGGEYDVLWRRMDEKLSKQSLEEIRAEEGIEEPLFKKIREDGSRRELPLIVDTLKAISKGEIDLDKVSEPIDLSEEVERRLQEGGF
ncbi:MAG: phosphoribosylglycinamide formyltransferase 1 [Candidatus Methanomethylophilaceae archaeon]|nr:phosphoribosylglycinamide formyltransferase 1 [Candidatus Methanomethylophilaceae archaeon]MDI3541535.1 phosphoribosylglycinamide formyltransferase 1 [Candidatus Methanomethylophilaceae archaeon]